MPTSSFDTVPVIAQIVRSLSPNSVLDVGIGFGKYGYLVRELQDIAYERYDKKDWKVTIVGVEAFEKYRTPIWDYIYDSIVIADIRNEKGMLKQFDLVLFIDVLEHMEHDEGMELISVVEEAKKHYIVSVPNYHSPQGAFCGNEFERHISVGKWSEKDFKHSTLVAGKLLGFN